MFSQANPLVNLSVFGYSATFVLAWLIARTVYYLYFHPLAKFPGPRRAAVSNLWLYSVSKQGRPEEVFEELHEKYKTRALRIAPNELHISDSNLYHTLYSQRQSFTKDKFFYDAFNTPHSVFVETDLDLHRQRRKILNTFFSKSSIRSTQHILYSKVTTLCNRLSDAGNDGPINMYHAFRCLTVDFITEVAFGKSFDLLVNSDKSTFDAPFLQAFDMVADSLWDLQYNLIIRTLVANIPTSIAARFSGPASHFHRMLCTTKDTIDAFRKQRATEGKPDHEVIFDKMLDVSDTEILAEAMDILIAGSDTTATTLAVALEELIKMPQHLIKLQTEVRAAGLETEQDYDLIKIEQLPYLSACVKEALRYAMPVPGRLPRVVPRVSAGADPLIVDGSVIPHGVLVGISAHTVHFDEKIWGSDARSFNPERWLTNEAKHLEKFLVTFSKGARQCLGINLAYAETTLTLAMLVRRFAFRKDETMAKLDLERVDMFTMGFRGSGLQAYVRELP